MQDEEPTVQVELERLRGRVSELEDALSPFCGPTRSLYHEKRCPVREARVVLETWRMLPWW